MPEYLTFYDLRVAIQDSTGWLDSHFHDFRIQPLRRACLDIRIESPFALDDFEEAAPLLTTEVAVALARQVFESAAASFRPPRNDAAFGLQPAFQRRWFHVLHGQQDEGRVRDEERRGGTRPPRPVKKIALTPQELRHLDILLADPIVLRLSQGISAKVPNPSAFLLHQLFLAARPERRNKSEKDIKQAVYTGQYALADTLETVRLLALWAGLPRKWKSLIRKSLARAKDMMPLERGVIERLMDLLR